MKAVYLLVCLALARESVGSVFRRQQQQQQQQQLYPASMLVMPLDEIDRYQLQQRLNAKQNQRVYHPMPSRQSYKDQSAETTKKHQGSSEEQYSPKPYRTQAKYQSSEEQYKPSEPTKRWQQGKIQQSSSSSEEKYMQKGKIHQSSEETQYMPQERSQKSTKQYKQDKYQQSSEEYRQQAQQKQSNQPKKYTQKQSDEISSEERYQSQQYKQKNSGKSSEEQRYQSLKHDSTEQEDQPDTIFGFTSPLYADKVQKRYPLVQATPRSSKKQMKPVFGESIEWRGVKIAAAPSTPVNKDDIQDIFSQAYETLSQVSTEEMKTFHETLEAAIESGASDEDQLNATQLLRKNQYDVEEHTIKTEDGYYLTLFRIAPKVETSVQKPVVFLMHGLLGSADDWLLMGPGKSLAYLLADAGYEVWLGNSRGSKYSRRHVSKHPALADFWQFSNDEIALFDLPAMIDYALNVTKQEKLYYVGYSQGTTAFFALASTRPEYNDKIIMMYALSPMAYMSNVRSPMLRMIAPTSPLYDQLHHQLGHGRFMPSKELVSTMGGAMCQNAIGCKNVCSNVNFVMSGVNVEGLDVELIPRIMRRLPAGGSTRQIKQYAQGVASQEFTKYDFGPYMNEKIYGSAVPPKYEMSKVSAPVSLYYAPEDWLASPRDVRRLQTELINVKDSYMIPVQHFSNMDFQFSKNAPEAVYNRLIESIKSQDNQQTY